MTILKDSSFYCILCLAFTSLLILVYSVSYAQNIQEKVWLKPDSTVNCNPETLNLTDVSRIAKNTDVYNEFLALGNDTVQLEGIAESESIGTDCTVNSTNLAFQWSLDFQNSTGSLINYTQKLNGTDSLFPIFSPDPLGRYYVGFTGGDYITEADLDAVRRIIEGTWVSNGPHNIAGHISAIVIDPATNHIYAGAETGGVWKSTNDGRNWIPLTDNKLPSNEIESLAIDRSGDTLKVYAGLDPVRYSTAGIFVSNDGGLTWERSGDAGRSCDGILSDNSLLSHSRVTAIKLNPFDHSIIYVGTDSGVFRSSNFGECWYRISRGFTNQVVTDLEIAWTRPFPTIFAGVWNDGIYKTTDQNPTQWSLTNLVPGSFYNIVIAASQSQPNVVYAGLNLGRSIEPYYKVFKSTNTGETWQEMAGAPQRCVVFWNQCHYNNFLAVDPGNPEIVLLGQVDLFVSNNGGRNWVFLNGPNLKPNDPEFGRAIHTDQHAIFFDPSDSKNLYVGNDGGLYKFTIDRNNPQPYYSALNDGLVTTQFYDMGISPNERIVAAGGTQDNQNMVRYANTWEKFWQPFGSWAGDGFENDFDSISTDRSRVLYYDGYWGDSLQTRRTSSVSTGPDMQVEEMDLKSVGKFFPDPFKFGHVLRISVDNHPTPGAPGQQLYRATNANTGGLSWKCIDPTPTNSNDEVTTVTFRKDVNPVVVRDILVGMADGSIYLIDGQVLDRLRPFEDCNSLPPEFSTAVTKIYPAQSGPGCFLPLGSVNSIAVDYRSSQNPELYTMYATFTGTGAGRVVMLTPVASSSPVVFCGRDISREPFSQHWLPDGRKAQDIVIHPHNQGILFLGTDKGIFVGRTIFTGGSWQWSVSKEIPNVNITALKKQETRTNVNGIVHASTYGRGMFYLDTVQTQGLAIKPLVSNSTSLNGSNSDIISSCEVRHFKDPRVNNRAIHLKVGYMYDSKLPDNLWIRPVIIQNNSDSKEFVVQAQKMQRGDGNANLIVIYAGKGGPLALNTTSIRLEVFDPTKGPQFSAVCQNELSWISSQAKSLKVDAILIPDEGASGPFPVPVEISSSQGKETRLTNFEFISAKQLSNISLKVPAKYELVDKELTFSHWILDKSSMSNEPRILLPSGAYSVVAVYTAESESGEYDLVDLSIRSTCSDCKFDLGEIVAPVDLQIDARELNLYTPIDYKIRPGLKFMLEAAPEILIENKSLHFVRWNQTLDLTNTNPISISISDSTNITSIYELTKDAN